MQNCKTNISVFLLKIVIYAFGGPKIEFLDKAYGKLQLQKLLAAA
jgi:hypothetical protein